MRRVTSIPGPGQGSWPTLVRLAMASVVALGAVAMSGRTTGAQAPPPVTVSPSPFLHVTASADIVADGAAARAATAFRVTLSKGAPFRLSAPTAAQRARGVVAIVTAGRSAGHATVTVSNPHGGASTTLPLESETSPAQLVAGKGAWISFDAYGRMTFASMLSRMAAEGVTHVYVETTGDNFIGATDLNALVDEAHNLGIAVIAFAWAPMNEVAQEIRAARQTIDYTTAGGGQVDGFAADLEIHLGAAAIATFSAAVRRALGPERAYVAIIYAPQFGFPTPIATLAKYVNAFAPMDYWDSDAGLTYSPAYAFRFVTTSIRELRQTPGEDGVPIEVVSQTQDIASDSGFGPLNPPAAQVAASAQAAAAAGAVGVSFYELVNQTAAQIAAISRFHMP